MRGESLGSGLVGGEAGQAGCSPNGRGLRAGLRGRSFTLSGREGAAMLGAGEVNRAHLCLVSFFKATRQPLLPPVSPEAGCPCSPSSCPGLGEACQVGLSFAPTSGSEGQMKDSGCARGCRWGGHDS